jgi:hypothetical protein
MVMGWVDWGLFLLWRHSSCGIQVSQGVEAQESPQGSSFDGLGGKLQRLPTQPKSPQAMAASSHTGGRHSAAGVDTTGKEVRALALSSSGFALPQAVRTSS